MSIRETAMQFVDACDSGKGWEVCKQWAEDGASFACQAEALAGIGTLEGYVGWAKDLLGPIPDGHYELRAAGADEERKAVIVSAVFRGTNTGPGPVPPTGNTIAGDYVYVLEFAGDRVKHMTKIWNDVASLKQLGWA